MKAASKLIHNRKFQILTILVAVLSLSLISGIFAFLTDVTNDDPLTLNMNLRYGNDFKIDVTGPDSKIYTDTVDIMPGENAEFQPVITNKGNYDTYVFIEIALPDHDFSLIGLSNEWTEIERDDNNIIYAYGSPNTMTKLERMKKDSRGEYVYSQTPELCAGIELDYNTDLQEQPCTVSAVGYAIQSDGNTSKPFEVWTTLQDEWLKNRDQES